MCRSIIKFMIMVIGGADFYTAVATAVCMALWAFIMMQIWRIVKLKNQRIVFSAAAVVIFLVVAGFELNKAYIKNIDEVSEQGVDLTLYEPFKENTKAVTLGGDSALKLSLNLPKLDGATALYPLYSAFARAVYPENNYPAYITKENDYVVCTNTDGAYRRLIKGEADVIFVAGPSKEQLQMASDAGMELKLIPIGREAFVFFVNSQNPVNGLSVGNIQRIYSGEAINWKEFGGKNDEIKAFQRPVNSGSQTALIKLMGDTPLMTPPSERVAGLMGDIINIVSYKNFSGAIGYSFLFFVTEMVNDNKIKLLAVNGIAPTRENVANNMYPYASEFYAVTAGTENPNAEKLIDWILSEQGQELIKNTGYTPIGGKDEKVEYKKITPQEAQKKMDEDVIILDVRTQEEFDAGHIKGAVLLPDYEIKLNAEAVLPDKAKTILVYCRSGRRSQAAANELIAMGYTQVFDFGGIIEWTGEIVR